FHHLEKLTSYHLLDDQATLVVEHKKEVTLPESYAGLRMIREETYSGKTTISMYTYEQLRVEEEKWSWQELE
ncbi:hypothetical protein R0J91_15780, partial [Micrococcus sp. SIMBA_131]